MLFPTRVGAVLLACTFGAIDATGQTFSIDSHVVSAGSTMQSSGGCFRMRATVAEPVAGYSQSTDYAINAGFQAVVPITNDEIFSSGFEACQ
jgi:hypothetical protein